MGMVECEYRSTISRPPYLNVARSPATDQPPAIGRVNHCCDIQVLREFQQRFPGTHRKSPDGGVLYIALRLIHSTHSQNSTIGRKAYAHNLSGKIQRLEQSSVAPIPDLGGRITRGRYQHLTIR